MNRLMKDKAVLGLALIGVLFAGYLTFTKLFSGTCAVKESCPYFLGYPACIYGLIMYSIILIAILLILLKKYKEAVLRKVVMVVSGIGILFSGYFMVQELFFSSCPIGGCEYSLLLPTCVYGLIMYTLIFTLGRK